MQKQSIIDKIHLLTATLFGVGYTPLCPGTASCVVALIIFILIKGQIYFLIFTILIVIIAFIASARAEKLFGIKDCKLIVIDDFAGMLITFLFIPKETEFLVTGFFLFRMLDMLKIPPADKIEKLPGASGVVGDDLVAGVYANLMLQLAKFALKITS